MGGGGERGREGKREAGKRWEREQHMGRHRGEGRESNIWGDTGGRGERATYGETQGGG